MATPSAQSTLQDFLSLKNDLTDSSKESSIARFLEGEQFERLRTYLAETNQHNSFIQALQNGNEKELRQILQTAFEGFENELNSLPPQVSLPRKNSLPSTSLDKESLRVRSEKAVRALDATPTLAQSIRQKNNSTYIHRLVQNYSRWTPQEQQALKENFAKSVLDEAETNTTAQPETIISTAAETLGIPPEITRRIVKDKQITKQVEEIQANPLRDFPFQYAEAVLTAPDPEIVTRTFLRDIETTDIMGHSQIAKSLKTAPVLSSVYTSLHTPNEAPTDFTDFFKNISQGGTAIEKAFAPLSDFALSRFPASTREAIAVRVLTSSWQKQVTDNNWLQKVLGPAFQSNEVQNAIRMGNAMFSGAGTKATVTSGPQNFLSDLFTTIFHPNISEIYLQLAAKTGAPNTFTFSQYYSSLLAQWGIQQVASGVAKKIGGTIVQKTATSSLAKSIGGFVGSFFGPGVGTAVGIFLGDVVAGKLLDTIGTKIAGFWNFLSFKSFQNMFQGSSSDTSILKDAGTVFGLILIGILLIPILTPAFGGANYNQLVQDNAYIQSVGTGGGNSLGVDCAANPTHPICTMAACDTTKQDCRWPTSGIITQGPHTICNANTTHYSANAIDIAGALGTPVYSTIKGTVTDVKFDCPNNVGKMNNKCGNGYGNYVEIQGDSYKLRFGHLLGFSIPVRKNQMVEPTTIIGQMDQSGYSSGSHLHFELLSSTININSILPFSISGCVNEPKCSPCTYPHVGGGK